MNNYTDHPTLAILYDRKKTISDTKARSYDFLFYPINYHSFLLLCQKLFFFSIDKEHSSECNILLPSSKSNNEWSDSLIII